MRNTHTLLTAILFISKESLSLMWEMIRTVAYSFFSIIVACLPFLDIEQTLLCKAVAIIIFLFLGYLGVFVSKNKVVSFVSGVADVISIILLFIA